MSSTFRPPIRAAVIRGVAAVLVLGGPLLSLPTVAQQAPALVVRPLAERRLAELPSGPLFWRVETFPSVAEARAAEGSTALVAEAAGKVWLFTLGRAGGASPGRTTVAEVGPIPEVRAPQYLLRINQASGPPGSVTPVHTHPGSEAFYVLAGEMSQTTAHGVSRVAAGQAIAGHGADVPMQVSSSGSTDLHSLVMFVVDATKPFSSTASIQ
jgi:quercetin dioxygenase-like cupin family protein